MEGKTFPNNEGILIFLKEKTCCVLCTRKMKILYYIVLAIVSGLLNVHLVSTSMLHSLHFPFSVQLFL